ncbi:phage head morphogenesis protein [Rhodocyclus tenuis]|uniref:SPP1 gp7 family putative phage head morphogenesis protein n=1 Tax=Rhodocyclus tenuis TaxID=1066 RepID=A0A840FYR1_RHOTE|nr:phage minor head protein [Rhodocyclus tenuis]MBB4247257.1 SPP1 gp7 family putative phage head morphogenesis protein [Rhodocyclus tenuis]
MPANVRLQLLPAADAVAAFQARGLLTQTFSWQDLLNEEHARQFTVAKLFRDDLLGEIYQQLGRALTAGGTLRDFQQALIPQLKKAGWWGNVEVIDPSTGEIGRTRVNPARLELIYDVNVRQAHAAGRWARSARGSMPYLIYRTRRDERVRASHRRWDAIVLPKDHPWWDTHYPPNGWRCRCLAYPIDDAGIAELEAAGLKLLREPPDDGPSIPFTNKITGEITQVPWGIDPGFAYNPGKGSQRRLGDLVLTKNAQLPPTIAARAVADHLADAGLLAAITRDYRAWAEGISRPVGAMRPVGALTPATVAALEANDLAPASAMLAVVDAEVIAARADNGQPSAWLADLPAHLAAPQAVLRDHTGSVLLVFTIPGQSGKWVIPVDLSAAGATTAAPASSVRIAAGHQVDARSLAGYEIMSGKL